MKKELFEIIYRQDNLEIWIDKKTGVNYVARVGDDFAITPMLDENGDVVVTPLYIVNPNVKSDSKNAV